ncbi:MAG: hydrogenase expression/formation protein [Xanthomonadales bacterium]|nr:hydrogenase expression/formation protein [Gammaproteobacteria bacterium]MBT8055270.1 hydrogenase expression/formation protein [Gammaproteobacteria bacterium]NND56771.1 hydrogenase expression/formation protein [Xanthomonadales bacterium]NNL06053.1 hydrogenase expression/formation protein [Xanthomonadales bacterium]
MRDSAAPCLSEMSTGMASSVLAEIGRMLDTLAGSDEPGSIDLRSLPLSDADRAQLEELLGRGEVSAELALAGDSEVWETTYPGVWWIRHRGAGGKIASEVISVCRIPEILMTHPADIEAAASRLREKLETTDV